MSDELLEHGSSGATLSGIARAIGTNNRMLLYYFNSKDELFSAASMEIFARYPRVVHLMAHLAEPGSLHEQFDAIWADLAHEENRPFLRFFFEAFGVASHRPEQHTSFLAIVNDEWPPAVTAALRRAGHAAEDAEVISAQVLALWRGLQFALLSGTPSELLRVAHSSAIAHLVPLDVATA